MKTLKRSKHKSFSDAEIEQFCRSVEDVLTQIKTRSSLKKGKKAKSKDLLIPEELLLEDEDMLPIEDELLIFHE